MLKRLSVLLTLLAFCTALTGCFHQQVIVDKEYNASKSAPDHQSVYVHIIGLIGVGADANLNQICPGGTGIVENKTFITIYAVTIQQKSVYCR